MLLSRSVAEAGMRRPVFLGALVSERLLYHTSPGSVFGQCNGYLVGEG
jgi:hypothetical protein